MAFKSAARRVGDEIGWLTPYTVTEFSDDKAVFDIAHCKVLDYPGSEDVCHYGCQLVLPKWQAEQFGVRLNFKREGHACTCTVTPLDQSETPPEPAE